MRKTLTYESAKNLKELDLLDKMETVDALDEEIDCLTEQMRSLRKEFKMLSLKTQWKQKQVEMQTVKPHSIQYQSVDTETFKSFSKREGVRDHLKLGDLVFNGFTKSSKKRSKETTTPQRGSRSLATSRREISHFSLSSSKREKSDEEQKNELLKNLHLAKSEKIIRWQKLGFVDKEEGRSKLDDQVVLLS